MFIEIVGLFYNKEFIRKRNNDEIFSINICINNEIITITYLSEEYKNILPFNLPFIKISKNIEELPK